MKRVQETTQAALAMVTASVFIAVSTFLAKGVAGHFELASDVQGLHPLQISAGRFLFGWLFWLVVCAVIRPARTPIHWRLHIARSFFGWLTVSALFWASALMALADATAISFLTPVVTLILAVVYLREKVGPIRWSAVTIMLTGAIVLLRPGTSAFQPAAMIALLAACASGFEAVFIKRLTSLEPHLQILLINNSLGLLIAMAAAAIVWINPSLVQWGLLLAVGMSMAAAQVFFLMSMGKGDASYVVPFMYSSLIFASVLDFQVFGDAPDPTGLVGIVIIVSGACLLAIRESKRKVEVTNS